eukprot:2546129-Pyramimonas_sp.AAC.1
MRSMAMWRVLMMGAAISGAGRSTHLVGNVEVCYAQSEVNLRLAMQAREVRVRRRSSTPSRQAP